MKGTMNNDLKSHNTDGDKQAGLFPLPNEMGADAVHSQPTPVEIWNQDSTKRALDELFSLTLQYRSSKAYHDLLQFIVRFRFYSPFNAMLVHVQMPGARYVASPHRWLRDYGRKIKPGARALVILQPMGPVMFVFDVSDTEGNPLPQEIENPFEVRHGKIGKELIKTIDNAKRDGIAIHSRRLGSQQAGSIRSVKPSNQVLTFSKTEIPLRYEMELNEDLSKESQYVTVAHELSHLYCGHLGTPNDRWWPDRRGLDHKAEEFEAESVAYMVCTRLGIDNPSEQYLAGYVDKYNEVPNISLECVMKAAGLIESMGREILKPRKNGKV